MKNLQQIKNDYAKSKGYDDFNHLILDDLYSENIKEINSTINELLILVQKECLKKASENADTIYEGSCFGDYQVDKESITNENNIIK